MFVHTHKCRLCSGSIYTQATFYLSIWYIIRCLDSCAISTRRYHYQRLFIVSRKWILDVMLLINNFTVLLQTSYFCFSVTFVDNPVFFLVGIGIQFSEYFYFLVESMLRELCVERIQSAVEMIIWSLQFYVSVCKYYSINAYIILFFYTNSVGRLFAAANLTYI